MVNFYVSVIYFSLPSFPESCTLIKNRNIVPRDVLLCNKINEHHIRGGMQYDPNVENGEYRVCESHVRMGLQKRVKKYDNLYILFRTRFFSLDGSSKYLITGFYDIKRTFGKTEYSEAPIVYAKQMHFVSLSDSIDVTKEIEERQAFRCCFNSENIHWEDKLENWFNQLNKLTNQTEQYITEINDLKRIFFENEVQGNNYLICKSCRYGSQNYACPLAWRLHHRSVNPHPANYMENLDEYFRSISPSDRTPIT